eukprot:1908599-Pyramimonas_sp.AAC.1
MGPRRRRSERHLHCDPGATHADRLAERGVVVSAIRYSHARSHSPAHHAASMSSMTPVGGVPVFA